MWHEFDPKHTYLASGDIAEGVGGDSSVLYIQKKLERILKAGSHSQCGGGKFHHMMKLGKKS